MSQVDYPGAKWKASPFVNTPKTPRKVRVVVIHTAECSETAKADDNVANWFADARASVSAHYVVDNDSVTQCVREQSVAWHASQANSFSIGIELAGSANQTPAQWADPYSLAVLDRGAQLVADICLRHDIPICRLTPDQLKAGRGGIVGHIDVTNAYNGGKGHYDPGKHFDWLGFIELVAHYTGAPAA